MSTYLSDVTGETDTVNISVLLQSGKQTVAPFYWVSPYICRLVAQVAKVVDSVFESKYKDLAKLVNSCKKTGISKSTDLTPLLQDPIK